jgi:hypothetical protein
MTMPTMLRFGQRAVPPVVATISPSTALAAVLSACASRDDHALRLACEADVNARYAAMRTVLTDSGTSALALALHVTVPAGGIVAIPGFGCVDVLAAARHAGLRVRTYDVAPDTLSPDLESLGRALERGAHAVIVTHLFGFAADMPRVLALAHMHGATVIEDAAQGSGGRLHNRPLGAFADLVVLSFGRGKGMSAGGGGALVARSAPRLRDVDAATGQFGAPTAGWTQLAVSVAVALLARPNLYALPASIPSLRLGEVVFRAAHDAAPLSRAGVTLLRAALRRVAADVRDRGIRADRIRAMFGVAVGAAGGVAPVALPKPLEGSTPGWLRFPVRAQRGHHIGAGLGIVRPYPRAIADIPQAQSLLADGECASEASRDLAASLWTLPTHHHVTDDDVQAMAQWTA